MVNLIAALKIAGAASKLESTPDLLSDAMILYGLYTEIKSGKFDLHQFASSARFKPSIIATANVLDVASELADDPEQLKNIIDLIESL